MQMPRLEIEQQMAKIGIEIQHAQLHVEMRHPSVEIEREPPKMTVDSAAGDVALDMDAFKANLGLKNYDQLMGEAASKAFKTAAEATRDIVNTAAFVGDTAIRGENKVGAAAKNKMLAYTDPGTGRSGVPPQIDMEGRPGWLEIEWTKGELSFNVEGEVLPEVYVEPPCSVDVHLTERPHVSVALAEGSVPQAAGRRVSVVV